MLQSISWQNYFITLFVCASIYYSIIWFIYFRNRVKLQADAPAFLQEEMERTAFKKSDHHDFLPKDHPENIAYADAGQTLSLATGLFVEELEALTSAFGENAEKTAVLSAVNNLIKKHSSLHLLSDQAIVREAIKVTCKRNCFIDFSEQELIKVCKVEG